MRAARTPPLPAPMMKRSKPGLAMSVNEQQRGPRCAASRPADDTRCGVPGRASDFSLRVETGGTRDADPEVVGRRDRRPDRAARGRGLLPARPPSPSSARVEIAAPPDKVYAAGGRSPRLEAVVGLEQARSADADRVQRPAGRHGREVDLEEQEPGRRRDDLHRGGAGQARRLRPLLPRLRHHLERRAALRAGRRRRPASPGP